MSTPRWQSGTLYQPGAVVRPVSAPRILAQAIENPSFEDGDTGWTKAAGWTIVEQPGLQGAWVAVWNGTGTGVLENDAKIAASSGGTCSAHVYARANVRDGGDSGISAMLRFYRADDTFISSVQGGAPALEGKHAFNVWTKTGVSGVAPPEAAYFRVAVTTSNEIAIEWRVDQYVLTSVHKAPDPGLVFTAVQASAGFSASSEPDWPATTGEQVVDHQVTWEALEGGRVVWRAHRILVSGATEPTWPTDGVVPDNTIAWERDPRRITDERAPHSKVVTLAASKIFATDDDIVPYCATVNPLDWQAPDDAGYLPFGLQTYGAQPATALGLYRGNLVVFNSAGFQMWQVDEDPANMALLDAAPIGSEYPRAVQPVANDLLFLSKQGSRSIGIAGGSTNLQAGDFGKQIDPLVQAKLREVTDTADPLGLYIAGMGQYWLIFEEEAFVLTINGNSTSSMSWSRYTFPSAIDDWTSLNGELYLRSGNLVWRVSDDALYDDEDEGLGAGGTDADIVGAISWPYLDLGQLGRTKMLGGFDLVIQGECTVSFGYDQKDFDAATAPYAVSGDTLTGEVIPMPLAAPSVQLRLEFAAGQQWEWNAAVIYISDFRLGS